MLHIIIIVSNQHVKDLHYHFDLHLLTSESELYFLISACGHGDVKFFLCIRYTLCAGALTCLCCCSAWLKDKLTKKVALREDRGCFMPPPYPWHSQIDILMLLGDRFQIQVS